MQGWVWILTLKPTKNFYLIFPKFLIKPLKGEFQQHPDGFDRINRALQNQDYSNTQYWAKALEFHFPEICATSYLESEESDNTDLEHSTSAVMSRQDLEAAEKWIPLIESITFA